MAGEAPPPHLTAWLARPTTPQQRLHYSETLARQQLLPAPAVPHCSFCFSQLDLARADITLMTRKKLETVEVRCQRCHNLCRSSPVTKVQLEKKKADVEENSTPIKTELKKNRSKKDKNAGIVRKSSTSLQTSKPPAVNRDKLKLLMSKDETSGRSRLQDFLKQL